MIRPFGGSCCDSAGVPYLSSTDASGSNSALTTSTAPTAARHIRATPDALILGETCLNHPFDPWTSDRLFIIPRVFRGFGEYPLEQRSHRRRHRTPPLSGTGHGTSRIAAPAQVWASITSARKGRRQAPWPVSGPPSEYRLTITSSCIAISGGQSNIRPRRSIVQAEARHPRRRRDQGNHGCPNQDGPNHVPGIDERASDDSRAIQVGERRPDMRPARAAPLHSRHIARTGSARPRPMVNISNTSIPTTCPPTSAPDLRRPPGSIVRHSR